MGMFGDFFDSAWEKTKESFKAAGNIATLPAGALLDFARYAPLTPNDMGPDWLSIKTSRDAFADALLGNGTLTGWALTKTGEGLNWTYENAVENPVEALVYHEMMPPSSDPVSWSQAWDLAKERNLGQTSQLWLNESANEVGDLIGVDGDKLIAGIPLVGGYLAIAGGGAEENKDVKAVDPDAWTEFQKYSPFWSGATASAIDLTAQVAGDPFLIAGKLTQAPRLLRTDRPVLPGEEAGLAERMADERTHKILGLPSKKAGLQSRTDPLIGTVKYEDEIVDGQRVVDGDGVPSLIPVADRPGWLDGKSPTQVYAGLNLKTDPYGDGLATALSRTNLIKNPADRVNVRRDILAARAGDASAFGRLTGNSEAKEFAYSMSNMARGRGTGELEIALADEAALATGKATSHYADPEAVAGIVDELHAQNGFKDWLYASNKARTLVVSAKGNRALARLAGQGLGRDGTLHTGRTGFDDIVNNAVLGKFKSDGSYLDEGIATSDELAPGAPLRDGKVYDADSLSWSIGPNLQPATFLRAGIKVAGWGTVTPFVKGLTAASDALRGKTITGALNVEDAPLTIAVTENFLREAKVAPEEIDRLMSSVISASGPTPRGIAVKRAEDHAIGVLADRYGVNRDMIAKIQEHHALKRDAVMAAARGQSYSAHVNPNHIDPNTGRPRQGDLMYLPDEGGAVVMPILDTQTINNLPLLDLPYVETWLRRNKLANVVGDTFGKVGRNPQTARANELGFNSRVNSMLESDMRKWTHFVAEESNAWWKRGVLLLRAPAYATRNAAEEMMRVAAVGQTALVADAAARHGAHRAADHARRKGNPRYNDLAPEYATLELRRAELEELQSLRDDPDIVSNVKAVRSELSALKSKRTRLLRADENADVSDLDSSIAWIEEMPYLVEHRGWADEISALENSIAGLTKSLENPVLPDSGFRNIGGVQFPDTFQGVGGRMAYERVANSGAFDAELTELSQRSFGRQRGVGESNIVPPRAPGDPDDVATRQLTAWAWILNKQIAQDPAGRIALGAMAERVDDVAPRVQQFLDSPAGSMYRRNNPHRSHDTEAWADEIAEMVKHHAVDDTTAQRLLDGEVSKGELAELWPDDFSRPAVHAAGVDGLMGVQNRKFATWTGQKFKQIDKMSVNALTRHPFFSVQFRAEQDRLAADFMRKVELEQGPDGVVSLDDINNITERARKVAANRVRQTFYDTSTRSSAAQRLRFIYPFFAAHQNSMTFWGSAIAQNPNVLRAIQLGFQAPSSLGLVVDQDGNPVEPGKFIESDHQILLQVPKAWGGPDPSDPTAKQTGFRISLNSLNLIMPSGSIINPGAGPLASIPAGYVQKKWGSQNEDVAKMLAWFNPFGAPKQGDSAVLPSMLQGLDPALPTPIRRLGTAWDAFMGDKNSREYTEMWSLRFQEAQVKFAEEYERQPNKTEAAEMEKQVDAEVRHMAGLRFVASFVSPAQPSPSSRLSGFIAEFRKLQEIGRNEGRGPFWASDTFLDKYGEAYMALTRSTSENRGNLDPSTQTVRTLEANKKLVDQTSPETWRLIVGAEGDSPDVEGGAFSMNAYRWMQDKSVSKVYGGGKLIQRKDAGKHMFSMNAASGWREFSKYKDILLASAVEAGYPSVEKSPQLNQLKSDMVAALKEKYPDWYQEYVGGSEDFENTYMDSIRKIASDKKLLSDPARRDIVQLKTYVDARDAVFDILKQRDAAGGSADPSAVGNQDVAALFAQLVDQLAESNTSFSTYAVDGIISRDPLYKAGLTLLGGL